MRGIMDVDRQWGVYRIKPVPVVRVLCRKMKQIVYKINRESTVRLLLRLSRFCIINTG